MALAYNARAAAAAARWNRPRARPEADAHQGDEAGLQYKGERDHARLVADGPQHPHLLTSLHHRAGADHPQRGDAHQ